MGNSSDKKVPKQVLLVGLSGSGKTRFLYETYAFTWSQKDANTRGFNYEIVDTENGKVGVWDCGGSDAMRSCWCCLYQNVRFDGVIFMIESGTEDALKHFEQSIVLPRRDRG